MSKKTNAYVFAWSLIDPKRRSSFDAARLHRREFGFRQIAGVGAGLFRPPAEIGFNAIDQGRELAVIAHARGADLMVDPRAAPIVASTIKSKCSTTLLFLHVVLMTPPFAHRVGANNANGGVEPRGVRSWATMIWASLSTAACAL